MVADQWPYEWRAGLVICLSFEKAQRNAPYDSQSSGLRFGAIESYR
jgi:hypothetical protein